MIKRWVSVGVAAMLLLQINLYALADGSSTPPTRKQRINIIKENDSSLNDENDKDDYESQISRPVVNNTEYEILTERRRPERPIVDLSENDSSSANTRPTRSVVDLSENDEDTSNTRPTRPVVNTTSECEDDIGTHPSQMPSRPTVDTESVSSPNTSDRPNADTANNHSQQIEDTKSTDHNFFDVSENHSNYQAICALSKKNIISGDGSGYFRPNDYITRAEFVKIICIAFDLKMKSNTKTFNDVRFHWAKDYIYIAASNGLISGVSENEFAPNDNITYQQISKIIVALKGWGNNAIKLGGYPDGYVKVMINNSLFEKSAVDTNYFKSSSYYNSKSSRADVAQIVCNAMLYNSADKTIIDEPTEQTTVSQPATVTTVTPYIVTSDLGESVTGTDNPTPQQIYNYVYNRIKDREVYRKDPNVLNAIMAMIWKESGGKHYENGNIKCNSDSSSKDYGICQLNDAVFSNAKYWGWRENLNAGIDKYATAYWMCMGEETKYNIYLQSVEKALRGNYAQTYQEARARTAYCMYNSTNDGRERWFTEKDGRDTGFYNRYVNKEWAKTLTETGNQTPVDKPQVSQSSDDSKASTATTVKYDGKSYTYIKNSKTYKIATKSYSTDDFANIQDVWRIFYGYNPTLYNDNPLYGRLEWYCEGIGSLCVEYDMRNVSDDNIYQFDIYRFTQDGNKFILPTEYIGYGKILSGKLTMTKHGDVAFIGIKNLANIFACDIDYKNQIKSNSTMQSNLQKITDKLNNTSSAKISNETNKVSFEEVLEIVANKHIGNKYDSYGYPSGTYWCVYCALAIAREAMTEYGCSDDEIDKVLTSASYSEGSTGKMIFIYNKQNRYYSYTKWTNSNRKQSNGSWVKSGGDFSMNINTTNLDYIPKAGDFIAVETGKGGTPDHTGLVVSVNKEKKTFVSIEGNSGKAYDENGKELTVQNGIIIGGKHNGEEASNFRRVRWVDYIYSDSMGKWVRTGGTSYYVHGFMSPDYPK